MAILKFFEPTSFINISVKVLRYEVVTKVEILIFSNTNYKIHEKLTIFRRFFLILADRLYRWIADHNRPINRN